MILLGAQWLRATSETRKYYMYMYKIYQPMGNVTFSNMRFVPIDVDRKAQLNREYAFAKGVTSKRLQAELLATNQRH